ncbi:c-type cytochrome domain-containing protein [Aestuariivivens sediminis]|uniref:c-type cytochrome domain-containing protein n=1 Tax=Aestuariivivens sediminis TaxID=2913557 RepID=UPI001F59B9CF|nr:c-type cytochrome domain-containing protein [Aestuariivivens sediminis]
MDWNLFIGRFHPVMVHLPIGIFILGYGFEILFQSGYRNPINSRKIIIATYGFGLLSGIIAAVTGWQLSLSDAYGMAPLNDHKYLGIATLVLMLAVIIYQIKAPEVKGRLKLGLSTVAIVLTALTGHFGGNLTHGSSYLVEYGPEFLKGEADTGTPVLTAMNPDSIQIYGTIIRPLLDHNCTACHHSESDQGGLILEDYPSLFKASDHNQPIAPGDPFASEIFTRVSLPADHEKAMPPRGAGFGYTDIQILKYWIENGADSLAVFNSDTMTPELIALINRDYGLDYSPKPYYDRITVARPDDDLLAELRHSGYRVHFLSETNFLLDVAFMNDSISTEHLKLLGKVSDHVTILKLVNCHLTDDLIQDMAPMTHLTRMDISKNKRLSGGVAFLTKHDHLESVNFNETALSKDALEHLLTGFDDLRVYVRHTNITPEERADLSQAFPRAEIISEFTFEKVEQAKSVFRSESEN